MRAQVDQGEPCNWIPASAQVRVPLGHDCFERGADDGFDQMPADWRYATGRDKARFVQVRHEETGAARAVAVARDRGGAQSEPLYKPVVQCIELTLERFDLPLGLAVALPHPPQPVAELAQHFLELFGPLLHARNVSRVILFRAQRCPNRLEWKIVSRYVSLAGNPGT